MFDIVSNFSGTSNQWINIAMLMVALLRVYLELIKFDFTELPVTKGMFRTKEDAFKFHRSGLYFSLGYIVLSAPFTLLS